MYTGMTSANSDESLVGFVLVNLRTKPGDLFSMEAIKRSVMDLANMNQFDPEALQAQLMSNIKPDPVSGTVDITYPLVSKGGDQIELSAGWGQTGIVGRVGLKFTNFSVQNLFRKGYKRAGFIPQGDGQTLQLSDLLPHQYDATGQRIQRRCLGQYGELGAQSDPHRLTRHPLCCKRRND